MGEIIVADDIGGHFGFDWRLYSHSDVFIYKFVKLQKLGIYYDFIYICIASIYDVDFPNIS